MRMGRNSRTAALLLLCVGVIFGVRALKPHPDALLKTRIAERALGDEKAPVWITEYFDYQCPPCASARGVLEKTMAESPGRIYLQARYFPLPAHKHALKAAVHAECVSRQKGKFWKFHEEMLKNQSEWSKDPYAALRFAAYAEKAGVDIGKLNACVQDPETEKTVLEEKKKAQELGVQVTPTFFVNGKLAAGINGLQAELAGLRKEEQK